MSTDLLSPLKQHFGFTAFRPGQREAIERLMAGRSVATVFPTGGGKSLCYQLPGVMLEGLTLVVSPLIALMKDQIDALHRRNIPAARLDSTLGADEHRSIMQRMRGGELKLLYVAPERLANERFRQSIERQTISLLAIDEAHCISEWGHNFRPDYLKLAEFARRCRAQRVLTLTATAPPRVLADICRVFDIDQADAIRTGFYRSNLRLVTKPVTADERDGALLQNFRGRGKQPGATIVYVTLQKTAERIAGLLTAEGFDARPYHAGLKDEQRTAVQEWFLPSERAIVVATIAFGMGIDKPDIRYVDHYNLPKSLENYSQEIGRAGRDDKPSTCTMFACADDLNVLENFVYGDTPDAAAVTKLVQALFKLPGEFDVSLFDLSYECDIRQLVLRTLLTYLELDGYIEAGTPFYTLYRFKPRMTSQQILAKFDGERRAFLSTVLGQAKKAKLWFTLDIDAAVKACGTSGGRDRVVTAIDYLAEQGMMEVEAEGLRHRFRRLKSPDDLAALAAGLHKRMVDRESAEIERLKHVLRLVEHAGCQSAALAAHFGETLKKPCGHCTTCDQKGKPVNVPARPEQPIPPRLWQDVEQLRKQKRDIFRDPRPLARFLVGVTTPKLSRARVGGHALFGALSHVPFREVLAKASN